MVKLTLLAAAMLSVASPAQQKAPDKPHVKPQHVLVLNEAQWAACQAGGGCIPVSQATARAILEELNAKRACWYKASTR